MKQRHFVILLITIILAACGGKDISATVAQATNTIDPADIRATERQPTLWAGQTQNAHVVETSQARFTQNAQGQTLTFLAPTATFTSTPTPTITPTPTQSYFVLEATPYDQPLNVLSIENAEKITELARWGYGAIDHIMYSHDGKLMIVQSSIQITAYQTGTLNEVWDFEVENEISSSILSKDGTIISLGTFQGEIYTLHANNGSIIDYWNEHNSAITSLDFSPDDTFLISTSSIDEAKLWKINIGKNAGLHQHIHHDDRIDNAFFIDDGLVAIQIWTKSVGTQIWYWDVANQSFLSNAMVTIIEKSIKYDLLFNWRGIYSLRTIEKISELSDVDEYIQWGGAAKFSNDGRYLAIGDIGDVVVWNVNDGSIHKVLGEFNSYEGLSIETFPKIRPQARSGPGPYLINSLDFSSDDKYLMATDGFGEISIWDVENGDLVKIIQGAEYTTSSFSPDGRFIISIKEDILDIFEFSTGELIGNIPGDWRKAPLIFSPGGTRLANGSRIWEVANGNPLYLSRREIALGFSNNGNYVYSIFPRWWVRQRTTADLLLNHQVQIEMPDTKSEEFFGSFTSFSWWELWPWALSPDEKTIRSGAYETQTLIWDLYTGEYLDSGIFSPIHRFIFSSSGKYLAEETAGNIAIFAYDSNGTYKFRIYIDSGYSGDFAISPDEKFVVTNGYDDIEIYSTESGLLIDEFKVNEDNNYSNFAFSPDGNLLAISIDSTIYLLDFEKREILYSFKAHFEFITSLTFSPNGIVLASSSQDGTVRLWGILP